MSKSRKRKRHLKLRKNYNKKVSKSARRKMRRMSKSTGYFRSGNRNPTGCNREI